MRYKTSAALEMAAKAAARRSALDTGRAMTGVLFPQAPLPYFQRPASRFRA